MQISNFKQKIKSITNVKNIGILILFAIIGYYSYGKWFKAATPAVYQYVSLENRDIEELVEGSGNVSSLQQLGVQPLTGGQVTAIYIKPGDTVSAGQIIARLDNRSQAIQLQQARASYDKVVNGAIGSDIDIARNSLKSAQLNLENAKKNLSEVNTAQNLAVKNSHSTLLNSGLALETRNSIAGDKPTISGAYTCDKEGSYNIDFQGVGYSGLGINISGLENDLNSAQANNINAIPVKIGACGLYLNFDSSKTYNASSQYIIHLPNTQSSTYLTNLNNYNNALQNKVEAIRNAESSVSSNEISLTSAQLQLDQKLASARPEDMASAQASLASAQLAYSNTIIKAPFAGQVGDVNMIVGQQVSSASAVATILTKTKIVDLSLNEVDIVNVKLGQDVRLKFDAIPDLNLTGKVTQINSVGVTASNVVNFTVRVQFDKDDERVKSGMSVTANIIISSKKGVPTLPNSAIKEQDNKTYVSVGISGASSSQKRIIKSVEVITGVRDDVYTEIISGVTPQDKVVKKVSTSTSSTRGASSGFSLFRVPGGGR